MKFGFIFDFVKILFAHAQPKENDQSETIMERIKESGEKDSNASCPESYESDFEEEINHKNSAQLEHKNHKFSESLTVFSNESSSDSENQNNRMTRSELNHWKEVVRVVLDVLDEMAGWCIVEEESHQEEQQMEEKSIENESQVTKMHSLNSVDNNSEVVSVEFSKETAKQTVDHEALETRVIYGVAHGFSDWCVINHLCIAMLTGLNPNNGDEEIGLGCSMILSKLCYHRQLTKVCEEEIKQNFNFPFFVF